jgi:hypothetical protein
LERAPTTASARLAAASPADRPRDPDGYPIGGYSGVYFPADEPSFHPTRVDPAPQFVAGRPRRGRRAAALLLTVLTVVGIAAFKGATRAALAGVMGPAHTYAINDAGTDHTGDLLRLLPPTPAQSQACSKLDVPEGPLTLDQEATFSTQPTVGAGVLRSLNFQRGAMRCWVEPDGTAVVLNLFQFDTANHAAQFHSGNSKAEAKAFGEGRSLDGAGGVPGGRWFRDKENSTDGYELVYAFVQRGDILVHLILGQPGSVSKAKVLDTMQQQYARL